VLHHGASVVIRKILTEFAGRFRFVLDQVEYLPPSPIGESLKDHILIKVS
jgi:hypothetical protein